MGSFYRFICDDCGYEAEASGGPDAGMLASVQTMTCSRCHNIADVTTEIHGWGLEESDPDPGSA